MGNFSDYDATYNKFETLRENTAQTTDAIEDASPDQGVLGVLNGLISASWGAVKNVYISFGTFTGIIEDTSTGGLRVFNLPTWFTGLLISMIAVTIAFALMAAWFQWRI